MADRGDDDRLLALDVRTGELLASAVLESDGHGAELLAHDDGTLLVGVAQGQDGGILYLTRFDDGVLTVRELAGAPDGVTRTDSVKIVPSHLGRTRCRPCSTVRRSRRS